MNKPSNNFYLLIILSFFIFKCNDNPVDDAYQNASNMSSAIFKINTTSGTNSPFSMIADHGIVRITGFDMDTMTDTLMITDSTVEGTINRIPAGNDRMFEISVYDSVDSLQYYGSTTADLPKGSTVNIPITIFRVGANAIMDIEIIENPDSCLVAFYPFDGNANDSIHANNGIVHGASPAQDRSGNENSAYEFDGADDYIIIPHSDEIDLSYTSFTLSLWVRFENLNKWNMIFYNGDTLGSTNTGSKFLNLYTLEDSTIHSAVDDDITLSRKEPGEHKYQTGSWYLITFIRDTSENLLKLYYNTELDYTFEDETGLDIDNDFPINIGRFLSNDDTRYFQGKLDDLRIYKRVLSEQEIQHIYQNM